MQPTVRKRQVIKLGGSMLDELSTAFFDRVKQLQQEGIQLVIVHGGGPNINQELADRGISSSVVNGFRVTCGAAIGVIQSILIGQVNPALVHRFNNEGAKAIGLYVTHCEKTIKDGFVLDPEKSHIDKVYTADPLWHNTDDYKLNRIKDIK